MPYLVIENFAGGVDDRKSPITSPAGSLIYANNCHLTAGGEIEKRRAFIPLFAFPPDARAIGLGGGGGNKLYIYGNGVRPANLYSDFEWVDVSRPGDPAVRVRRFQWWSDLPYALVEYQSGQKHLWLGAVRVDLETNWTLPLPRYRLEDIVVFLSKLYGVQDSFIPFSGVGELDRFGNDVGEGTVGAGFIDASEQGPHAFDLVAADIYQNRLLAFSRNALFVYGVDPDPAANQLLQAIPNFGCIAPRSIVGIGELDRLFLSRSGVRSVRARDSSNVATVADAGSPINRTINRHAKLLRKDNGLVDAVGVFAPDEDGGRYWLALGDVIYVFSYFPSSKISGWTTYTPGFDVVDMAAVNDDIFVLSDGFLYSYGIYEVKHGGIGALADSDYDTSLVDVILPYLDGGTPATQKKFVGLDVGIDGTWEVLASFNTRRPDHYEPLARLTATSFDEQVCDVNAKATRFKLRFRSESDGYAALRTALMHYELEEAA